MNAAKEMGPSRRMSSAMRRASGVRGTTPKGSWEGVETPRVALMERVYEPPVAASV